jgi:hypothetical protein
LLSFDNTGGTLSGAPRFTSASWIAGRPQIAAIGMANVTYAIQTCADLSAPNWTSIGTVKASVNGQIQFTDSSVQGVASRYYRLVQ